MSPYRKYSLCVALLLYPVSAMWISAAISNSEPVRHFIFKNQWAEACLGFTQFAVGAATILNDVVICIWVADRNSKSAATSETSS